MIEKNVLREIGFTEGEIKVYFALFDLGETTVGPISKKSRVTHAKVYPILDKLIEKGLVSHVIKDGRKNFSANNPNTLLEYVDKKIRVLKQEKGKLKKIIPSLLLKQKNLEEVQYSRVFEGFGGLRSLFYELFGTNENEKEILVFGLNELLDKDGFVSFFRFYHDLRKLNKIGIKLILNRSAKAIVEKKYKIVNMYGKNDLVKYTDTIFPVGVFIFGDHVINIVADDKITAFDIKSKQNALRFKSYFDSIWRNCRK